MAERLNIGIIDADLIGRKNHRFPNLCCMKISAYCKEKGYNVSLLLRYDRRKIKEYDYVFISKVFTDTKVPGFILELKNVRYGGTGFYFDKAKKLPYRIEHHMPDYHLYDEWINEQVKIGKSVKQFRFYTDYSIGFVTRGCFRKCDFCVNKKYNHVFLNSNLEEFCDPERKKICLLDDNILGFKNWKEVFKALNGYKKPFVFRQGLDERLLTDEKCSIIFNSKYDGDFIFAFDDIKDYSVIESKLKMIRRHTDRIIKFYVLCGFKSTDIIDIEETFIRIKLLMKYKCLPYIMRYQGKYSALWKESKYKGIYTTLSRWCNQPSLFKKKSFKEFCMMDKTSKKYFLEFERKEGDRLSEYFNMKWGEV